MRGFVYLFASDGIYFKIGKSTSPKERVKAFATLPWNIRLENRLHIAFAPEHVVGEWFKLDESDLQFFRDLISWNKDEEPFFIDYRDYSI